MLVNRAYVNFQFLLYLKLLIIIKSIVSYMYNNCRVSINGLANFEKKAIINKKGQPSKIIRNFVVIRNNCN